MKRLYLQDFIALVDENCCKEEIAIGEYIYNEDIVNPHNNKILKVEEYYKDGGVYEGEDTHVLFMDGYVHKYLPVTGKKLDLPLITEEETDEWDKVFDEYWKKENFSSIDMLMEFLRKNYIPLRIKE